MWGAWNVDFTFECVVLTGNEVRFLENGIGREEKNKIRVRRSLLLS